MLLTLSASGYPTAPRQEDLLEKYISTIGVIYSFSYTETCTAERDG